MPQIAKALYEFGPYRIDARQGVLYREHERVYLTPKAFETLLALVEAGGEIVDREALLARVWPGTFVEEGSLSRNISVLRKALSAGDSSREWIETIPKRGYRFIPPKSALPTSAEEPVEAPTAHRPSRRNWLLASVSGVVFVAAGLGVWWWMSRALSSPIQSMAVLPF
jgi:DNA-binding winged helix-turn-helix (wHTH) protein